MKARWTSIWGVFLTTFPWIFPTWTRGAKIFTSQSLKISTNHLIRRKYTGKPENSKKARLSFEKRISERVSTITRLGSLGMFIRWSKIPRNPVFGTPNKFYNFPRFLTFPKGFVMELKKKVRRLCCRGVFMWKWFIAICGWFIQASLMYRVTEASAT